MNGQSTYISEQIRDASGEYINPSTIGVTPQTSFALNTMLQTV